MKKLYIFLFLYSCITSISQNKLFSQSVLDPNDPIVEYDSLNPPVQPPYNQIGKWVRTKSLSWNSDSYKAYIYQGSCFRLKFPKSYNPNANDGKKYPIALVFHGGGEAGPITDNETQLYHGGLDYGNAGDNGTFDGYILFMQSQGFWGITSYMRLIDVINYMIANNKLDPFRISVNGLSSGGQASWDMVLDYPNYTAASLPMSNISIGYKDPSVVNAVKFTPIWDFQGALDGSPAPSTAQQVRDAMVSAGGDYKYSEYANVGHSTWDSAFAEPDFFPFMLRAYSSNPWTLYGRTNFCNGDPINLTLGVPPGFNGYQWKKDAAVISNATSNTLNVTALGTYYARVLRGSTWSDWSHIPVVVQITPPTVTPPITVAGAMSNVLESADGKNYVNLQVPGDGYTSYTWKKVGSDNVIGTNSIYTANQPGQYIAAVTQQYGCSSVYSPPFTVVDAKGANAPDAASKLTATSLSSTEVLLNWENNPHPIYNETYFEIYRSTAQNNNYSFVGKVSADSLLYKDSKLSAGINYFYKIRAVNNNGAAPLSNIASASTNEDNTLPVPPANVKVVYATNSSIKIQWDSSTDNVGVKNYEVYINGVKSYSTTLNNFTANALQQNKVYTFFVKAVDSAGNHSIQSNTASSAAALKGFFYKYYEGYWLTVPDFNALSPLSSGVSALPDVSVSARQTQFAFLWQGYINIPVTGAYRIGITSDDGSKLWLNEYDPSITPLIDNDHLSSVKTKYAPVTLQQGVYPISIAYFQNKNATGVQLNWICKTLFGDSLSHPIDASYFTSGYTPADTAPKKPGDPTATVVDYKTVKITWADNSNNETGFQVYRSLKPVLDYSIIYTSGPNVKTYTDSGLSARTRYYYKINATNNFGTSSLTNYSLATTTASPTPPKPPTNLKAVALSASSIKVTWTDVATDEINYLVLRSSSDTSNFKTAALLPANSTSFTDTGLYGNTYYFYKVKAVSATSTSVNKPAAKTKTQNNPPVILNRFAQQVVRYGIQNTIQVVAVDSDADPISFSVKGMPAFGTFADNNNGTATLTFNPSSTQQGSYSNIRIIAKDTSGGSDTDTFMLTVNDDYAPAMDTIADYTLDEGDALTISLTATDQNAGDTLTWSVTGAPDNYTLNPVNNGKLNLHLHPTYAASGTYQIQATVSDGKGRSVTRQFNVIVNDKDPGQTVYLRFKDQDAMGLPWNDITSVNSSNFKDVSNVATGIGLNMQTSWFKTWHEGPSTGNNSGIYPDPVLKDYYFFGSQGGPSTVTSKFTGLDTSKFYNISFYGGSVWSGASNNGSTIYTIGSQSITLNVQNNTTNTADFINIKPAADGTVTFIMTKAANAPSGYINAIVIKSLFTDSSKPLAPEFLSATNIPGKGVRLTWNDVAYNETGYNVYRALNSSGPFTLITGDLAFGSTSFIDTTAAGNTQYYYTVKAETSKKLSDSSNIVGILTPDRVPVIDPIASITIKNNQQQTINVNAVDDNNDHITLMASNLPSFVTFKDNHNGTGSFTVAPANGIIGTFEDITVTATDNSDSASSVSFNITVTDQNLNSVYINFSNSSSLVGSAPWNNFYTFPSPNATISNLLDDNNALTTVSLKFLNGFQGNFAAGMQPGNNKGVYPEVVMRTGLLEGGTKTDSIQVSGLTKNKKYNFVFFNSRDDGLKGNTNFTVGAQSVTLNATHNINKTAEINGIVPDANGRVTIKVSKVAGADYAFFNTLIIQSFDSTLTLLSPSDLRAGGITRKSVNLQWADRSSDETGFEIWRAKDSTGSTYSLLNTVAANTTSYVDSNLIPGFTYYYIVRAVKNSVKSSFCSVLAATTYSQVIFVNFSYENNANVPWNNTAALPELGLTWNNLFDNTGLPSSISMQQTGIFAGMYSAGMNTGSNSGIFPDKVMIDNYGLFTGQGSTMKVTGLSLNMKYDFTFFASSNIGGDVNTAYTINGKKSILNASFNIDGTVTIYNVVPDNNGEVVISIAPNSNSSQYGLIGALLIQEYGAATNGIPTPPHSFNKTSIALVNGKQQSSLLNKSQDYKIFAYPNPFNQDLTVSINLKQEDNIRIQLFDIKGKPVYAKDFGKLQQGSYNLLLKPGNNISAGIYFVEIIYGSVKPDYIKIIKQ
ncbi:MAG: fibronectin type III domain-containing protein [Parafilimonas sp.]